MKYEQEIFWVFLRTNYGAIIIVERDAKERVVSARLEGNVMQKKIKWRGRRC